MKKLIAIMVCLILIVCMSVPAFAEAAEVPENPTIQETGQIFLTELLTAAAEIVGTLLKTGLAILGMWLLSVLGRSAKTKHLNDATEKVIEMAGITVGELQQQFVDKWKAENVGGKLTEAQKKELRKKLVELTLQKLSLPMVELLRAAKVDLNELIIGVGDDLINGRNPFDKVEGKHFPEVKGFYDSNETTEAII